MTNGCPQNSTLPTGLSRQLQRVIMRRKLLSMLALAVLVSSTVAGCGGGSSTTSTVATLSEIEGDVSVM